MLTPALIRGARAMLQMSQAELSEKAGISKTALANLELGNADSRGSTLTAIQRSLEDAGAEFFTDGAGGLGVRVRSPAPADGLQGGRVMKSMKLVGKDKYDIDTQLLNWRSANPSAVVTTHPIERLPPEMKKPGGRFAKLAPPADTVSMRIDYTD